MSLPSTRFPLSQAGVGGRKCELTQFYCYLCIVVFVFHLTKVPAVAAVIGNDDGA